MLGIEKELLIKGSKVLRGRDRLVADFVGGFKNEGNHLMRILWGKPKTRIRDGGLVQNKDAFWLGKKIFIV